MDGIGRAVGAPSHVEIEGRTYTVRFTADVIGELENYLLSKRKSPLKLVQEVIESLPPDLQKHLLSEALQVASKHNYVTIHEIQDFMQSREGTAVWLWINLRTQDDGMTLERCRDLVLQLDEAKLQQIQEAQALAGGVDELGNSIGPS